MGRIKNNNKKNREKSDNSNTKKFIKEPPDQDILDSIGSPNIWTPQKEDAWLLELKKIPAREIYRRFPPLRKPPSVRKRPKGIGWGDNV